MKDNLFVFGGVVFFGFLTFFLVYNLEFKEMIYYTQIDNTKIEQLNTTDYMKYKYTLVAYNKNGKSKEITFKTSRELRDKAFLKLTYRYISGVNHWEEITYDELSSSVKNKYRL